MNVIRDITIDLLRPKENVFHVVQEDSSRQIRLTLLENNLPFYVAADLDEGEELLKFVEFKKPDGHGGIYDTTSLGETAVELEDPDTGNVWVVNLDGQCFTCPGWTQINVRFETEAGRRIHTFRIMVDVEPTASSDTEPSEMPGLSIAGLRDEVVDIRNGIDGTLYPTAGSAVRDQFVLYGFPDDAKDLLIEILRAALYPTDQSENIDELDAAIRVHIDNITVSDGVMTIVSLKNNPTQAGVALTIT